MNRFVVGVPAPDFARGIVVPRDGTALLDLPRGRVWTVGHDTHEAIVTAAPAGEGGRLATAGHCLATAAERQAALAAGRDGDLAAALRLAGSHLTVLSVGGETWVAGDRSGVVPLYWLEDEIGIWWSTAALPLAALSDAAPDLVWLLADLAVTGVDFRLGSAHFAQMRRVPPGSALMLREHAAPRIVPVPAAGRPGWSLADGARQLRETLTVAVERRAQRLEPVTCDLSGGVDSSSVACLAVRERPVFAITYTDARMAEDDDVLYARRVAAEVDGITHQVISGRDTAVAHFDGLDAPEALPLTDLPSMSIGVLSVLAARLAPAASRGSAAHLTGRGGDNVLGTASSHRVDQFLAGHRGQALRRGSDFARAVRIAPWRAWRQIAATAATPYPRALARLADRMTATPLPDDWRPAPEDALAWCSATAGARWLTAAGRQAVADRVAARVPDAGAYRAPGALHDRLDLEWMAAEHATFDTIARQLWHLPIHAPFLDSAVADACLSIPSYQRARPGMYKPLARTALVGLVPEWLLGRQTKTLFTTSVFDGLAANAPALRRIVTGSHLAQAGLLDPRRATADLEAAIAGAPAPLGNLHALLVSELWLARLSTATARAAWWQPTALRGGAACA
ncbi:asparagine synthase-related protein [Streptomyces sp. XH2]|uniref:asparagine synthase-related protein n=1 Tax=Streptomyces sp. XH2 TaxID=3412483 RepID=UPI003C7CF211